MFPSSVIPAEAEPQTLEPGERAEAVGQYGSPPARR